MMKKTRALILSLLFTVLLVINLYFFNFTSTKQTIIISRVIDGDTIVSNSNKTIRLSNINTPEKGKPFYNESKQFLKKFENQAVQIELIGQDKHQRTLARIYSDKYLNLELVKQGLAVKFLVSPEEAKLFANTESEAIEAQKGQWNKSQCFNTLKLTINPEKEVIILKSRKNPINITNWKLKDESRKEYIFPELILQRINLHTGIGKDNITDLFWNSKQDIWNNDRDTIYIFDSNWRLVHHEAYGY